MSFLFFFRIRKPVIRNTRPARSRRRSASGRSPRRSLCIEVLEDRTMPSVLGGVGAVGDSYTVEYQFITGRNASRNWLEQLAQYRNVNFGAFSTSPWDAVRGAGYEYNWAVGSAANYTAQVAGLASQIASGQVTTAAVMGGIIADTDPGNPRTGDPGNPATAFTYLNGIYNGTLTGSALSAVLAANVASRTDTLDVLRTAGQQSGQGVNLVVADYANFADVPQGRQQYPNPAGRQNLVNADQQLNAQLEAAANARGVPVLDLFGFGEYLNQLAANGQPLVIAGFPMDTTDYTPSSQEFAGTPVAPQDVFGDEQHLGSVAQGLIANMFITAVDKAYGAGIPLFSDQELLQNAWNIAGKTPPPMTTGPTYFDVSQWVIFPTPTLTSLSTSTAAEGHSSLTVTVNGTNFLSSSVVQWNGVALPTNFVSSTQLTATIPAADLAEEGTATVSVVNPTPGGGASNGQTFTVTEVPPAVGAIAGPLSPTAVDTAISASASFTDPGLLDTHTAVWNWGDNTTSTGAVSEANGSGTVSGSHTYTTDGVYTVTLTVMDKDGASGSSSFNYVVVYDPSAGFTTGGGWFNSPAGAYAANPTLTGQANFGLNAKYKSGSTVPTGNTDFEFPAANLNFNSTSYDWLVINGNQAQYQGSGTINGAGNYGFLVTALDNGGGSTPDDLRIKIWDKSNNNAVIYDTQPGAANTAAPTTPLGGGRIQIHTNAQTATVIHSSGGSPSSSAVVIDSAPSNPTPAPAAPAAASSNGAGWSAFGASLLCTIERDLSQWEDAMTKEMASLIQTVDQLFVELSADMRAGESTMASLA